MHPAIAKGATDSQLTIEDVVHLEIINISSSSWMTLTTGRQLSW